MLYTTLHMRVLTYTLQEFERIQNHLRGLQERKQRLLLNLQSNPYQR